MTSAGSRWGEADEAAPVCLTPADTFDQRVTEQRLVSNDEVPVVTDRFDGDLAGVVLAASECGGGGGCQVRAAIGGRGDDKTAPLALTDQPRDLLGGVCEGDALP